MAAKKKDLGKGGVVELVEEDLDQVIGAGAAGGEVSLTDAALRRKRLAMASLDGKGNDVLTEDL